MTNKQKVINKEIEYTQVLNQVLACELDGTEVTPGLAAVVVAAGVSLGTALDTPCKCDQEIRPDSHHQDSFLWCF